MRQLTLHRLIIGLSMVIFLASLTQPAFSVERGTRPAAEYPSIVLLAIGWMAVPDGAVSWLANPSLVLGWYFTQFETRRTMALVITLAALALALSFLRHDEFLLDTSGNRGVISGCCAGYWLWLSSIITLILGNSLLLFMGGNNEKQ